ncbi:hypothetical protein [Turicibacter sanguinis]|uniref:hypothetical protein n=1 Tax=Turicibacter sanguinis TaxID=154288 RepID=UPI0021D4889A|nr:hypothetical protein [Turicibacter sanguinis]MCU7192251.1 hypothetical protein [Turicibacter sanguinis]
MKDIRLGISYSKGYENKQLFHSKKYRQLFITKKFSLKSRYKVLPKIVQQIKNARDTISVLKIEKEQLMDINNKVVDSKVLSTLNQEISYHHRRLGELENFADSVRGEIKNLESDMFVLVDLGDSYLSTHQKIQLLGGGVKKAQEIIEFYLKHEKDAVIESIPFMELVMHHTEYQWNKQRERDWIDCEIWEMPVFEACMNEMIRRMCDYEQETGRCFMTEFMEEHAKANGKKVVQKQTDHGVVITFEEDINTKYERDGKIITLNTLVNSKA